MFFCFLLHLYFLCSCASIFNFHVGGIKICTEDLFAQWQGLLTSGSCCEVTREEPPHGSVRRVFLLVASVSGEDSPSLPLEGYRYGRRLSLDLPVGDGVSCLPETAHISCTAPVFCEDGGEPAAEGHTMEEKTCMSKWPPHSLSTGPPIFSASPHSSVQRRRQVPVLSGLLQSDTACVLGAPRLEKRVAALSGCSLCCPPVTYFPPSHVPLPPRGGRVSRPLCLPGFCSFGP